MENSGWQLKQDAALAYEKALVPFLFRPWAQDLVGRSDLKTGENVLDVGCGTGEAARETARAVGNSGSICGLDINPSMIAVARSQPLSGGQTAGWVVGSAEALPFEDGQFDHVLSQQALQFVPEVAKAASEMERVLGACGRATISVWTGIENSPYAAAIMDAALTHVSPSAGAQMESPFTMEIETLRDAFQTAGFSEVTAERAAVTIEVPNVRSFVSAHLTALPFSGEIASTNTHDVVLNHVLDSIESSTKGDTGHLRWESWVLTAERAER